MQAGARRAWIPGRVTWWLIGIHVVLWFIHVAAIDSVRQRSLRVESGESSVAAFIEGELLLHTDEVFGSLKLWQPFTAFWFHAAAGIGQLFWNMLLLFFFGRAVESELGGKRYLRLYVSGGILAMFVSTGFAYVIGVHAGTAGTDPLLGAHGALYAVLVWLACREPRRTVMILFVVPAPLWVAVGLFMLGGEMVDLTVVGTVQLTAVGHLVSAAWGWTYFRRLTPVAASEPAPERPWWGKRAHYDGESEPNRRADVKQEVELLLAKIAAEGMESLTEKEKAFLQEASKRY